MKDLITKDDIQVFSVNASATMHPAVTPDTFHRIIKERLLYDISRKILEIYEDEIKLIDRQGDQYIYSLTIPIVLPDKRRNETK